METLVIAYRLITRRELLKTIERGDRIHLWNVVAARHAKGTDILPGSRRFLLDALMTRPAPAAPEEAIVLYGAGPRCTLAQKAAERLKSAEFRNVSVYEGGVECWRDAGLPLSRL